MNTNTNQLKKGTKLSTYSATGPGDPALTGKLGDPKALPKAVDGHHEHEGVEAEEDEDREVEEVLGSFGRQEAALDAHIR